ncbi:hypothetical protein ABK040_015809 [Willaertia magna]
MESTTRVYFHITNVTGTNEKPFEIKINSNTVYKNTELNISELKKTIEIDIPVPKFASVHNIYVNVLIPELKIDELDRYNLTSHGEHFIINGKNVDHIVKQCFDENGTTKKPSSPFATSSSTTTSSTTTPSSPRSKLSTVKNNEEKKKTFSSTTTTTATSSSVSSPVKSNVGTTTTSTNSSIGSGGRSGSFSKTQPTTTTNATTYRPVSSNIKGPPPTTTTAVHPPITVSSTNKVSTPVVEEDDATYANVTFWVYGIEGSISYPFRILVDGLCIFRCEHNLDSCKFIARLKEPRVAPEHKITLSVDMPLRTGVSYQRRIIPEKRYNLTMDGTFFVINCKVVKPLQEQTSVDEQQQGVILQRRDNKSFGTEYKEPELYDENKHEKVDDTKENNFVGNAIINKLKDCAIDEYIVDASKLTQEQKEKLIKIQKLEDQRILSKEEADIERKSVIGSEVLTKSKHNVIVSPRQQLHEQQLQHHEKKVHEVKEQEVKKLELKIFVSNIRASEESPFKLVYKPSVVMIELKEDVSDEKMICVKGDIPVNPSGDTIVPILISMPKVGITMERELNLTKNGRFVLVGINDNESHTVICKQQKDEEFGHILHGNQPQMKLQPVENNVQKEEIGSSKIFIHIQDVEASKEEPFVVFIGDKQAYKREEPLKKRQKANINGEVPKVKRINAPTDPNHVVSIKVLAPMISASPKEVSVDLTNDGGHVFILTDEEKKEIIIKQSKEETLTDDAMVCKDIKN